MDKIIKIGFQGIEGSHSARAAEEIAQQSGFAGVAYQPLVSSQAVVDALLCETIDYALVAVSNSIGGEVNETQHAIKGEKLQEKASITLPVCHYAFACEPLEREAVELVISHPQALKQCRKNIAETFVRATTQAIEDTAIGARYIAENRYPKNTVVLCSWLAGEIHNLDFVVSNMEDSPDNKTTFKLFGKG